MAVIRKKFSKHLSTIKENEGSVAVLTLGLFLMTLAFATLMTDIASIAIAKRSLIHASEAAVVRAVQSLDESIYYNGKNAIAIPINCSMARMKVIQELGLWMQGGGQMLRPELVEIALVDFYCLDNVIRISTTAKAKLPFRLPNSTLVNVDIHASVGAQSNRQN
ncbi:unannotated protein [freshwater metagenome]|uniref:Unannotated protein n=1 Tax=freshwater metagenome TaxID=449393 RepID=A0A6J7BZS6_9ZZZZ|nr:hypothetical protein [Actinomycetota bacterium]MTA36565.1 hypothetical protein [Actinomycetota bacterium]